MSLRTLAALALLVALAVGPAVLAQAPTRPDLERRLAELEKQLGVLLKEVKDLRKELQAPPPAVGLRAEIKVFTLRNANAVDMVRVLTELFQGTEGRALVVTADPRTNSMIVRGRTDLLEAVEAIVARLEEGPTPGKRAEPDKKAQVEKAQRAALERQLAEAEFDLAARKERASWSERMAKLGYLSEGKVTEERAQLQRAELALDKVKAELKALPADRP